MKDARASPHVGIRARSAPRPDPARQRARASRLRARADAARARLDALASDPADVRRWRRAIERVAQTSRAWARFERRARARAGVRRLLRDRRAAARLALLLRDAEACGRTVVYCRGCERPGDHTRGADALRLAGWGGYRDTLAEGWPRLWWCPACWVPPRVGEERAQPVSALPLSERAERDARRRSDSAARASVERLVRRRRSSTRRRRSGCSGVWCTGRRASGRGARGARQ